MLFHRSFPNLVRLSLLLAISSRVHLFFPRRGHKPAPILRGCLNSPPCLHHRRFSVPHYAKRPDATLYTIDPLFFLPTPFGLHCILKVSEHDSLWQPLVAQSDDERFRPQKSSRAQRRLDTLIPGYLESMVGCRKASDGLVSCAVPR